MADEYVKPLKIKLEPEIEEKKTQEVESKFKQFATSFGESFKDSLGLKAKDAKQIGADLAKGLASFIDDFTNAVKNTFKDAWEELENILNFSRLSNAETRDLAFTYGFSGSQAYGFTKAKDIMGIQSDEDLMYLTGAQSQKFQELMSKYSEKYSELYDSGFFDEYEEYQYEMKEFREEITMEVVKFFMDNKDTIKEGMRAIMKLTEFVLNALSWLVNFLGGSRSESQIAATTNDIINSYATSNNKNTNVTIDNTFNNVAKEDQSWLANAGNMTYEQVIKALT